MDQIQKDVLLQTTSIFDQNDFQAMITNLNSLSKQIPQQKDEFEIKQFQNLIKESNYIQKILQTHFEKGNQSKLFTFEKSMLAKSITQITANLITKNTENQNYFFNIIFSESSIIDQTLEMCWYESDDEESEGLCEKEIVMNGEKALKNILVFIYNSCVQQSQLLEKFVLEFDGGSFLYRVHRYLYVMQENFQQNEIQKNQDFLNLEEWYALLIKIFLQSEFQIEKYNMILMSIFNSFVSKKQRQNGVKIHESGFQFVEKQGLQDAVLTVSNDQKMLIQFIKNYVVDCLNQKDLMKGVYKNKIQNLVSSKFIIFISSKLLVTFIDVFCAYFAEHNFKVIDEIYNLKELQETNQIKLNQDDIRDFMETIKDIMDLLTQISAFQNDEELEPQFQNKFREFILEIDECIVVQKCGYLMFKLQEIVDHLIIKEVFRPQENIKEILGKQDGNQELNQNFMKTHPFGGFLGSVVCLTSNLSYQRNDKLEKYWLSELGWRHIGLILANAKLDADNPTLKEWCIFFVRNVTSWSDSVRVKLDQLTLISGSTDPQSVKSLEAMGKPFQQMYEKEIFKYKDDQDQQKQLHESLKNASNVHVVDF